MLLLLQKREAKACLEAAGKLWAVTNQAPARKKDDEVYKVSGLVSSSLLAHWGTDTR